MCRGLPPPSHSTDHHSQSSCAFAQRAMLGAPHKNARKGGRMGSDLYFNQGASAILVAFAPVVVPVIAVDSGVKVPLIKLGYPR